MNKNKTVETVETVESLKNTLQEILVWNTNDIEAFDDCMPTFEMLENRQLVIENAIKLADSISLTK